MAIKLVHFISSLEQGGAQAVLYQLITQLKEYEHHLIYMHDGYYKKQFEQLGISVYQVSMYRPLTIIRLLKKIKPDCMHTSLWAANWLGRIAGWLLKIPCVSVLHNHASLNGMVRRILDVCAPAPAQMIAVSRDVHDSFGYAQCCVIHNGVGSSTGQVKTKTDLGFRETDFIIGSVGRFHPDKQYDLLIHAFALIAAEYTHVRLVLMGAGAQEKQLRRLVKHLNLDSKVLFIVGESAASYYAVFDCFVLTSKSEGISLALLEAMSNGVVPILAHADAMHAVIVHGSNGLLCSHDAHAIAQSIKWVMREDVRIPMERQAQKTVQERFSVSHMIQAYDQIFSTQVFQK